MEDNDEIGEIEEEGDDDYAIFFRLVNLCTNNTGKKFFIFHVSHWRLNNFDHFNKLTSFYLPLGVNEIKWTHDYETFYMLDDETEAFCSVCHQKRIFYSCCVVICLNEQCPVFKGNHHFIYFNVYRHEKPDQHKNELYGIIEDEQTKIIEAIEDFFCNLSNWEPKLVYVIFNYLMLNDFKNNIFF